MTTPQRFAGRFNEIMGSAPCVFDDAPAQQETAPVAAPERKWFKIPVDESAPKLTEGKYFRFPVDQSPPTHTDAKYFRIPNQEQK